MKTMHDGVLAFTRVLRPRGCFGRRPGGLRDAAERNARVDLHERVEIAVAVEVGGAGDVGVEVQGSPRENIGLETRRATGPRATSSSLEAPASMVCFAPG